MMNKRNGRPPLDRNDSSVSVTIRVTSTQYRKWYTATQRERLTSVGAYIRRELSDDKPPSESE